MLSCSATDLPVETNVICPDVKNVDKVLASPEPIIIIGEIHGYIEPPKLIEAFICHSLKQDYKTLFAIEISQDKEEAISEYVKSSGDKVARRKILSDSRWLSIGDGRQTQSIFNILNVIRDYKSQGYQLSTVNFVPSNEAIKSFSLDNFSSEYEKLLAKNIMDGFRIHKPDKMIVLVGNLHAKNGYGRFAGQTYQLMANYIDPRQSITLNISSEYAPMAIEIFDEPKEGYDGVYILPSLTKATSVVSPFR